MAVTLARRCPCSMPPGSASAHRRLAGDVQAAALLIGEQRVRCHGCRPPGPDLHRLLASGNGLARRVRCTRWRSRGYSAQIWSSGIVDNINPGDDFVERLTQAVGSCDILLALIGRQWLEITDATGQRRIDDPADFVRLEIATALGRGVRVIPILVDGALMPRADALPGDLVALSRRQAVPLDPVTFDTSRLLATIGRGPEPAGSRRATCPRRPGRRPPRRRAPGNIRPRRPRAPPPGVSPAPAEVLYPAPIEVPGSEPFDRTNPGQSATGPPALSWLGAPAAQPSDARGLGRHRAPSSSLLRPSRCSCPGDLGAAAQHAWPALDTGRRRRRPRGGDRPARHVVAHPQRVGVEAAEPAKGRPAGGDGPSRRSGGAPG